MTIASFPRRANAIGRLIRARTILRDAVASLPARKQETRPAVNAGRWAMLPNEYAAPWACPLDERIPAITAPGTTASIDCGNSGSVILHLAGSWSGHVAFEASADGVAWRPVTLASFTSGVAEDETDCPGLWRTHAGQRIAHLRLHVTRLSHGAMLASVAAAPSAGQPALRALNPAA